MYDIYVRLDTLNNSDAEQVLWTPGLEDKSYILYSAILELQLNHSGKLTFQISPKHPLYNLINKRTTHVIVRRNGTEFWRGRVLDSNTDFYKRRTIVCEGTLSYLLDTAVRPYVYTGSFGGYIETMLNGHNSECDPDKRIELGRITAVDSKTDVSINNLTPSEYPSTLEELNDKAVAQHGGYLQVRRDDNTDKFYLDYLSSSGVQINQQIRFGKNLLDLEDYITAENVCTRCIPLGATLREIEDFKAYQDPYYVSKLDDKDAGKRLDITSVSTGGVDYIEHEEGIGLFGKITRCVVFDNVVTAESLLENAQEWLNNNVSMNVSLQIKAIDLSLLVPDIDAIECGVSVEVISDPHEVNIFMVCSAMKLNILSPGETDYTFGAGFNAMTDQQTKSLKQSSKAFGTAQFASNAARNITETVIGNYVTPGEFNSYQDEVTEAFEDVDETIRGIETLPEVTNMSNGMTLGVLNGKWAAIAELSGSWTFNETINAPTNASAIGAISFTNDGRPFDMFSFHSDSMLYSEYDGDLLVDCTTYNFASNTWYKNSYRIITFSETVIVNQAFYEWFAVNAKKGELISRIPMPTLTLNGDILTITDESGLATSFDILVRTNGLLEVVATITDNSIDLSTLGLPHGEYYLIWVIAKADGCIDSDMEYVEYNLE